MATTGRSVDPTVPATTTPSNTTATPLEKALLREVTHLRKKLASRVDNYVEPADIDTDDYMRNTER